MSAPSNYFWIFSTFPWIFFSVVLTKILFWIFEILSFRFLTFFFWISPLHTMVKQKPQLYGKRATVERNRVKFGPRGWVFSVHRVHLTLKCLRSFWGQSVYLWVFSVHSERLTLKRLRFVLGSLGAFSIFNNLVPWTWLVVELWVSGMSIQCIQDTGEVKCFR